VFSNNKMRTVLKTLVLTLLRVSERVRFLIKNAQEGKEKEERWRGLGT
jgi:hypothetical protein